MPSLLILAAVGVVAITWLYVDALTSKFYVTLLVAPLTIAVAFGLRFEVGRSDAPPRVVINRLVSVLESDAPVERVDHDTLIVDVSKWVTVVITARAAGAGSVVTCHAGLSRKEWTTVLIVFIFFGAPALVFVPTSLVALGRSASFAAKRVAPYVSMPAISDRPTGIVDARESFSEALDEGLRMIWRARKGLVSQYHDRLLTLGIASLLVIFFSILGLVYLDGLWQLGLVDRGLLLPISGLNGAVALASLFLVFRHDSLQKMRACDSWADRFAMIQSGDYSSATPSAYGQGSLELLVHAVREVPSWLKAGDHGEYYREPGLWLPLAYMLVIGSGLIVNGSIEFDWADTTRSSWFILGILLVGLSVLMYVWWAVVRRRENQRVLDYWSSRTQDLGRRMDKYFEGL